MPGTFSTDGLEVQYKIINVGEQWLKCDLGTIACEDSEIFTSLGL